MESHDGCSILTEGKLATEVEESGSRVAGGRRGSSEVEGGRRRVVGGAISSSWSSGRHGRAGARHPIGRVVGQWQDSRLATGFTVVGASSEIALQPAENCPSTGNGFNASRTQT